MYQIRQYIAANGRNYYLDWLEGLRDLRAQLAVVSRVRKMETGNFGDHKSCGGGIWELRVDVGSGYRIYYAIADKRVVLLLCGGDKGSQSSDIALAIDLGRRWRGETMPDRSNDDAMAEMYRRDPGFAVEVLNDVLENGEPGELLIALRQMTRAFGGVQAVAEKAELNPTQLYRTLSAEGNPTISTLTAILKAMGLKLAVQPVTA